MRTYTKSAAGPASNPGKKYSAALGSKPKKKADRFYSGGPKNANKPLPKSAYRKKK